MYVFKRKLIIKENEKKKKTLPGKEHEDKHELHIHLE